jgi:pimeloyl-ACP methyl ester carboxylesterase
MADVNDVTLCYDVHGRRGDPAIVLIRGLGTQLIEWPPALVTGLVTAGLEVVVFDNRDAGLSSEMKPIAGTAPYRLEDMANDVVGLLDRLQVERAHILGISMGGMIAQHVAFAHPQRTRSLISVMSSTGNPDLPAPSPEMRARLVETAATPEALIALNAANRVAFGSPAYPESLDERMTAARAAYERSYRPDGVARQMRAVIADGSRVDRLRRLSVPTLVIHGADDPLIPVAAGRDTAAAIEGARLEIIAGMGHNIPTALAPRIVEIVVAFVRGLPN